MVSPKIISNFVCKTLKRRIELILQDNLCQDWKKFIKKKTVEDDINQDSLNMLNSYSIELYHA